MVRDDFELDLDGDRETVFRRLFDRFHRSIYRFFERRGFDRGECEDLTQEVFLRIHKGLDGVRQPSGLGAWIFQISANVYRHELRRRSASKRTDRGIAGSSGAEAGFLGSEGGTAAPSSGGPPGPWRRAVARERVERLQGAMEGLSPQMRRCVLLRGYQELTYEEIASTLRISVQTVKVHLHRARRKLLDKLDDPEL
jgi:RNA polymerase sigma-70 factor (ECF subfamily)